MLNIDQIRRFAALEANPCISIYLPTHRRAGETQQDPIRLKNLVAETEERLISGGMRRPEAENLLKQARLLVDNDSFWQHQSDGLAVFIAPGHTIVLHLPVTVPEEAHIGVRFHIKHLLPMIASNGRFYVLTIAQDCVRLFEGTRYGIQPVQADEIPESISEEQSRTDYQEKVGFHPTGPTPTTWGRPAAMRHSGGESPQDVRENELKEWLRDVANAVEAQMAEETAPLAVVADERNFGHFNAFCGYPHLLPTGITEHPERLDERQLHERAWALVEPVFARRLEEAKEHFASLAGESHPRAPRDLSSIVRSARFGRVDVLFVAEDAHVFGTVDLETGEGEVRQDSDEDGEDLLDRAAAEALNTGARVYALPKEQVPGGNAAAAILRY